MNALLTSKISGADNPLHDNVSHRYQPLKQKCYDCLKADPSSCYRHHEQGAQLSVLPLREKSFAFGLLSVVLILPTFGLLIIARCLRLLLAITLRSLFRLVDYGYTNTILELLHGCLITSLEL